MVSKTVIDNLNRIDCRRVVEDSSLLSSELEGHTFAHSGTVVNDKGGNIFIIIGHFVCLV
jgi:hypothetical protein